MVPPLNAAGLSQRDNRHQRGWIKIAFRHVVGTSRLVELVALRRAAPRPSAQKLLANRAGRANGSAAERGGLVAARQPPPHGLDQDRLSARRWYLSSGGNSSRCDE